jgi:tRNA G10  N-methylase Trm11
MKTMLCLAKVKFDLRDPDELYFAQREIDALLDTKTEFIKTIASLMKRPPFSFLDEEVVHLLNRLVYLGEGQGYLAETPIREMMSVVRKATFFREVFVFLEVDDKEDLSNLFNRLRIKVEDGELIKEKIEPNPYTTIFIKKQGDRKIITIRFIPFQTLFEYATEVKKLPSVVFRPKNSEKWDDYFREKEEGVIKGLDELLVHMKSGHYRSPHFGLGKTHIGDFVDWASTDLRKPFLHYLHKYKGKGDPRISRALINLLKVKEGETILDPFVGSGAFIADAPTMGLNAIGIEILHIGKMISEVKCNLGINLEKLRESIVKLFTDIDKGEPFKRNIEPELAEMRKKIKHETDDGSLFNNINPHLRNIIALKNWIEEKSEGETRKFFLILLSQQIVEFSEKKRNQDIVGAFKSYVEDRYLTLYLTRKLAEMLDLDLTSGKVLIIRGDSTNMSMLKDESIDGILTSPPYFDALDYIGNNKVSIIVLGLEEDLTIGSTKHFYEAHHREEGYKTLPLFASDRYFSIVLPPSNLQLISLLKEAKRIEKSRVVENYLKMMKLSFEECYRVLRKGRYYLMVVSKYHKWIIKGEEKLIETSPIIADLGQSVGFKVADVIEHGLSKADKGKIGVEDIIVFQK